MPTTERVYVLLWLELRCTNQRVNTAFSMAANFVVFPEANRIEQFERAKNICCRLFKRGGYRFPGFWLKALMYHKKQLLFYSRSSKNTSR